MYFASNLYECKVLLIDHSIIANFSKFNSIFNKHFSKFNAVNLSIGVDKIQNILWCIDLP